MRDYCKVDLRSKLITGSILLSYLFYIKVSGLLMNISKLFHLIKRPIIQYLVLLNLIGFIFVIFSFDWKLMSLSHNEWTIIYALAGGTILLSFWNIAIINDKDEVIEFSLDSSLYLSSIFLFGLDKTFLVLMISSIIIIFLMKKNYLFINATNFSIYAIGIITSYYTFIFFGGEIGNLNEKNILPYVLSLTIFMFINIIITGTHYAIATGKSAFKTVKETILFFIPTYAMNLLLSLVLYILIDSFQIFGLFLFLTISILLSITFKKHYHYYKEIKNKANKDHLTDLYNHGYFEVELEKSFLEAKDSKKNLCLVLIDIDDFKKFNDTYGHSKGDDLLKFIARIFETECTTVNSVLARYGGEEFTILLPDISIEEAYKFTNKLRKKLNDSYFEGAEILPYGCISFSAGIAEIEKEMLDKANLLDKADQAMYLSKAHGKNQVQQYEKVLQKKDYLDLDKEIHILEQPLRFFLAKDVYTYQHSKRVYQYALEMSKRLDLSVVEKQTLILGALIHDIGKVEIPREILNKKGKLTEYEWEMIKKHVIYGKEIISKHKQLKSLLPLIELHHERYDGKGYPHGLKGEDIPKLARLLCIIDSFDAMTTERPYQKTKTMEEGIAELRKCAGSQFDPEFVEPFINMIKERYLHDVEFVG